MDNPDLALRKLLGSVTESLSHVPMGPWESVGDGYVVFFVKDCTCSQPQEGDIFKHEPYCRTEVLAKTDPATAALMAKIPHDLPVIVQALESILDTVQGKEIVRTEDLLRSIAYVLSRD